MNFHKSKEEITEAVLKELPLSKWHRLSLDKVVFQWWQTGRGGQGLRLSDVGYLAFTEAKIAGWDFDIQIKSKSTKKKMGGVTRMTVAIHQQFITELSKKVKCPYYIGVDKAEKIPRSFIKIYDHKTAMMITLYGSLMDYIEAQDRKLQ
jgi:hypothetical protein